MNYLLTDMIGYVVDRCGKEVRYYVIDYYKADNSPNKYQVTILDVRSALDSFEAYYGIDQK